MINALIQAEEGEEQDEDDEITEEPESIICHDLHGKVGRSVISDCMDAFSFSTVLDQ